jgi:prophage regulatory protein
MEILLRPKQVAAILGISIGTLYRYISEGRFPRSIEISPRVRVWPKSVVEEWVQKKIENKFESYVEPITNDLAPDLTSLSGQILVNKKQLS